MRVTRFISSENSITIIAEDEMFENAAEMLKTHIKSKEKIFDVAKALENAKKKPSLGTFTYDASILALAEIVSHLTINEKVLYFGNDTESYLTPEQVEFDLEGKRLVLNMLIELRDAKASSRDIYDEYTGGDVDKDPYLVGIINMYIEFIHDIIEY